MPALTRFYGLEPEAFDRMTTREVAEYVQLLDQAIANGWGVINGG